MAWLLVLIVVASAATNGGAATTTLTKKKKQMKSSMATMGLKHKKIRMTKSSGMSNKLQKMIKGGNMSTKQGMKKGDDDGDSEKGQPKKGNSKKSSNNSSSKMSKGSSSKGASSDMKGGKSQKMKKVMKKKKQGKQTSKDDAHLKPLPEVELSDPSPHQPATPKPPPRPAPPAPEPAVVPDEPEPAPSADDPTSPNDVAAPSEPATPNQPAPDTPVDNSVPAPAPETPVENPEPAPVDNPVTAPEETPAAPEPAPAPEETPAAPEPEPEPAPEETPAAPESDASGVTTRLIALQAAIDAVGGEDALMKLSQWKMEAAGSTWMGYEGEVPGDLVATSTYMRTYHQDLANDKLRVDSTSTPLFEGFRFAPTQTYHRIIDGTVGVLLPDSVLGIFAGPLNAGNVAALKKQQQLFNPHILLQQAMENPDLVRDGGVGGTNETRAIVVIKGDASDISMFVSPETGLPSKIELQESHPLLGDTKIVVRYIGWDLWTEGDDSVVFPRIVRLSGVDGRLWDETRSSVTTDVTFDEATFALPVGMRIDVSDSDGFAFGQDAHHLVEGFFSLGFAFPYAPMVSPAKLLHEGIHFLPVPSGSNSLIIEYSGGSMLLEAPGSDIHGKYLLDAVAKLAPGKPLQLLLQSHHHVDHAGGVRTVLGTGVDLVVGHGVELFWSRLLNAKSTIRPDGLSRSTAGEIISLGEKGKLIIVDEPGLVVTVCHTTLDPHAEDAMVTIIETTGEVYVYQTDFYNAGFGGTVVVGGPEALFGLLKEIGIINQACQTNIATTIVPGHGVPQTIEESIEELTNLGVDVGC